MAGEAFPGPVLDQVTRLSRHRYFYFDKHHTPHNTGDAQWLPELSMDEEFAIFDAADEFQIADGKGNLFGLRRTPAGRCLVLGTESQEVAEFPYTRDPIPWHGYPLWPLRQAGYIERGRLPAPNEALRIMVERGWITKNEKRRLSAGKHIS